MKKLLPLLAALILTSIAHAQPAAFPSKPIRVIVPFNAGSGSDSASRAYGEVMARLLGQPVVVDNRPGGSGVVAIQAVKAAPSDGHTILLASVSPMAVNPVLIKNLPYDPFKDFRPVHGLAVGPAAFIVRGDAPWKTMGEFVAAAKKDKRTLSVGNYSDGYMLVGAWLGTAAGVPVNHVPYKGGVQMQTDVVGGQLDIAVNDFGGVVPLLKEGRLRVLAITSDKRDPMFPNIPTMKESGFPDFETYVWASFYVKADTPDDVTAKLADAVRKAMESPEGKAYANSLPCCAMMLSQKEMGDFQRREYERFKRVAEQAGITAK
jgi:tripartite-type tricarboxylate transporter receptor subunit TctC